MCLWVNRNALTCIYLYVPKTLLNTGSDQTFQPTVSSFSQNTDVTHRNNILQSHQCLCYHSADKAKGKIQRNFVSHKGVGEPWAHATKRTPSIVHEVSNPVGQNRIQQMHHKITFLQMFSYKCLSLCHCTLCVIHFPCDLMLFVWSGFLVDQGGRRSNWCPAVAVASQHCLHTVPLCPSWRIS